MLLAASSVDVPLWERTPGRHGYPLLYEELGVSAGLVERIEEWTSWYASMVFEEWTPEVKEAFRREGAALADALRRELGPDVEVLYGNGISGPADDNWSPPSPPSDPGVYRWDTE
ncbi:hypothetical protein GL263_10940 [Streptomyces durbertensis]|uniref:Uncharacterized protein n=1 Tax=Streptomyces durbertensis TaxID=2448886 RepID=A0ABR6EFG3_9ACTN|nr:hypothetical protein [Streptomyces durbertensis]MBB1244069.1 hypothetical protein [Streptomyces durbertensis]